MDQTLTFWFMKCSYDITVGIDISKRYTDRPFSWISGFPLVKICIGHSIVFTDARLTLEKDSKNDILNIIKDEKCDIAFLSPDVLSDLVSKLDRYFNGTILLPTIITGGQFIHQLHSKVIGKFRNNLFVTYGWSH